MKMKNGALLKLEGVGRDFDVSKPWLNRVLEGAPRQLLRAVDDVTVAVHKGETLALVGESGCGKSMTALSLMRLLPEAGQIAAGRVLLEGTDLMRLPEAAMRAVRATTVDELADALGFLEQAASSAASQESDPRPLSRWEQLAQVLLMSNEFMFVD